MKLGSSSFQFQVSSFVSLLHSKRAELRTTIGLVPGKGYGGVSFDGVYGKVYEIGEIPRTSTSDENCLANSAEANYLVTFAVNAIDSFGHRSVTSGNLFQDGTL